MQGTGFIIGMTQGCCQSVQPGMRAPTHPVHFCAAGYMVARALGAAPSIADSIIDQLSLSTDKARDAGGAAEPASEAAVAAMCDAVWRMVWPAQRLRQREFFSFGMDVLLKLDLQVSRKSWMLNPIYAFSLPRAPQPRHACAAEAGSAAEP